MSDPLEIVTISVGGRPITGFTSVSVSVSVEEGARKANVTFSDLAGLDVVIPGDEAVITASGSLLLTGYVRDVSPGHDDSHHAVTMSIESRTVDAIEASIDHPTGFTKDKAMNDIAGEFDTCGVGIECDEVFPKERHAIVRTGESLWQHLLPLARAHGAFLYDTPEGKLRIAKKPRGRQAGQLAIGNGGNILQARATISERGRHDEVKVRGQAARTASPAAHRAEAKARDSGVKRKRPLIVALETEASEAKLSARAERRIRRAAGYSRTASITVKGWRDAAGALWTPHFVVAVNNPRIWTVQDMGIKSVEFSQDTTNGGTGTTATLELVDPPALNGEGGNGGKKQFETPDIRASVTVES